MGLDFPFLRCQWDWVHFHRKVLHLVRYLPSSFNRVLSQDIHPSLLFFVQGAVDPEVPVVEAEVLVMGNVHLRLPDATEGHHTQKLTVHVYVLPRLAAVLVHEVVLPLLGHGHALSALANHPQS